MGTGSGGVSPPYESAMYPLKGPTLLIIDLPDGERKVIPCRTPASLRSNESVVVFDAEGGWKVPDGLRLKFKGSANITGPFGNSLGDLPWVVYCQAVSAEVQVDDPRT